MVSDEKKLSMLLKDCASGFYQHMYFLGKDVIHPAGNQLEAYGFVKSPSQGLKGTSCYTHESDLRTIELYGSCAGLYTASSKMVFLRKRCRFYRWLPEHRLVAGEWSRKDIQLDDADALFFELVPLFRWWIAYEAWIEERFGKSYRERCFAQWSKIKGHTAWLSPNVATEWVSQFLEQKGEHVRPKHFE